jgi:hypothetical protein
MSDVVSRQSWPDLYRRLVESGTEGEVQHLFERFLTLSERDPEGMQYVLDLFSRTLDRLIAEAEGR